MIRLCLPIIFLICALPVLGQDSFTWTPDYEIILDDFQSPQSEINQELTTYSLYVGNKVEFSFQMSSYQFMFTKNFNSKVRNTFQRDASVLIAPDTVMAGQMIDFSRYVFDLSELFARKFRMMLYEQKSTFSNTDYYREIYERLHKEMNAEQARVQKETEMGANRELLMAERQDVREQIDALADFCETCKPSKKKKKSKEGRLEIGTPGENSFHITGDIIAHI